MHKRKTHLVKEGSSKLVSLLMGFETACGIKKDSLWYTEDINTATCKKCLQVAQRTKPELFKKYNQCMHLTCGKSPASN